MDKRKEELEKKRQKLAELRRQREERKLQLERQKGSPPGSPSAKEKSARQNIDELVNSLVGDTTERTPSQTSSIPDSDKGAPGASDVGIRRSDSLEERPATPEPARPKPNLTIQDILILDLPPKEKVFYNKEIQTVDLEEPPSPEKQKGGDQAVESSPTPEPEISKNEEEQDKIEVAEISETERQSIVQSDSFKHFLESSTKVLERVLSLEEKQDYDWMKDYTTDFAISKDENKNQKLKPLGKFYDEKLCRGRAVTALDWSPIHPELHLASYNRSTSLGSQTDPDGLICVWNAHVESSPEFVFNSQSDILSSIFHPFNPHLIISATYTGQILIYDTRSRSTLPSLKTPLSVLGHTHPIYGMKYVGTKNAGTLVTGSTDGAVCGWQLDMLGAAAESIELIHPTHPRTEEVSITTLDFPGNETTTFWIGTEEGNLYQGFRYDRAGSKAGLNVFDVYKGHNGMVTSVHFHPANGPIDFSDLILSSSVDWTVRLWRAKSLTKPATTLTTHSPVHSFEEADDYVNDAKWSPVHPALFASVDGTGRVDLWNLNTDTESPTASHTPSPKALNKVAWDTEGKKISVGGNDGTVYVYEVHNDVAVPVADDWFLLQRKLQELERQNEDGRVGK